MKQLRNYLLLALLTFVGSAYGEGLKVSDFTISQGGTYDLAVELDDPASQYIMTEFWISLPSGVTIAKDGNGDFLAEKSDRFGQTHSFSISEGEGNAYHVLIYSSQNKPLAGNDAWLLKLKLEASENVAAGEYQGKIFSQKITDAERNNLTPAEATFKVTVQEASVVETDYFLVGSMNEWTPSDNYKLTANKESTGEYMITLDFAAGAEFQIATAAGDNQVWYPGGQENNCVINDAGNYTVYFRPDYSGGSDWFHNCIYVASNGVEPVGQITINPSDITNGDITSALATKIAEAEIVGDIVINLAKDESYTVTASIVAPASITINGNGATIDASALTDNMIQWTAKAADDTEWTNADIVIDGVTVKGLNKALFLSNSKYYYGDFTLNNSVVDQAADATTFDYTKGSVAVNFTVTNSTVYAATATTKSLYSSQGGQKAVEWNSDAVQTFKFAKNTMYNLAPTKNFFSHRQSNQKWMTYDVQENIFVNCGKSGQVVKGMNGGQGGANPTWIIKGNAFNFEGADTSASEETGDEAEPVQDSVAGVMAFTSVETPDFGGKFALAEGATQPSSLGDPRWTIAYEGGSTPELTEFYIMGTGTENEWAGTTAMTLNSETDAFEYEATLTGESYITFGDAAFTDWDDFNANHRYAIGAGDQPVTLDENNQATVQLVKVEGTIVLATPGKYLFSVSKDLKLTITKTADVAGQITINPSDITNGDITSALATKIAEAETVGDIVINLAKDESYTVTASIVAPASITINGNGATIDASALESAMITTPTGDLEEWMVGDFTLKDLTVKNLKKSLFASAGKNYLYNDFLIDNCIIDIEYTGGFEFDFRKGGVAKNFTIQNSTLYAPTATGNSLYTSQSAQKGTEAPGVTVQTFTFKKSTLYNIATGKNFFTHRQSNQTWLAYTLENNIFVNVGKSGQTIKGMNGGQGGANPTWIIKGNAFNFEGADTSASEETGDEAEPVQDSVAGVMAFTSVETPDFGGTFTLAEGATQPSSLGDPRWTIAYEGGSTPELTEFYIMGTGTENEWTGTTAMTLNSETDAFEYEATLTGESYITFGDAAFTDWDDFNANHRYAIGAGDQPVTLDENNQATVQLVKVEGTIVLATPGKYLFSVSKDLKLTITRTGDAPVEEADYYLTGTMTGWSTVAADLANYKLARNEGAEGVVEYMIKNVAFEAEAKFKVIKVEEGKDPTWYPAGMENDYVIQTAGNYDVYFRPNKDGGEGWHEGYIYATASLDKSALEDEIATATALLGDASTEEGTPGKALADAIAAAQDALQNATTQDEINNAVQALKDAEDAYKNATGIAGLYLGKYADGEWYTIQGVRIDRPTTKGLYIRNGRTVVVK